MKGVTVDYDDEPGHNMGLAMAKIMAADVPGGDPVLAKRTTRLMKEIEAHKSQETATKKRRLEKAKRRAVGTLATEATALNKERALQKVATRAVVALFNSINKHQHSARDDASTITSKATTLRPQVKEYADKKAAAQSVQLETKAALAHKDSFANAWARDDYLLDAKNDGWDDDDAQPPKKTKVRKDGADHAFLYGSDDRSKNRI